MSRFFSLATVAILLTSQLRVSMIVANYYLNREEITQQFCVNLPKGDTTCQGKCHLKRKLGEEKSRKAKNPEIIVEERAPLFCQALDFTFVSQFLSLDDLNAHYEPIYNFLYINYTFHPPEGFSS